MIVLQSVASGRSLRAHDDGNIDGTGGTGLLGEICVCDSPILYVHDQEYI